MIVSSSIDFSCSNCFMSLLTFMYGDFWLWFL